MPKDTMPDDERTALERLAWAREIVRDVLAIELAVLMEMFPGEPLERLDERLRRFALVVNPIPGSEPARFRRLVDLAVLRSTSADLAAYDDEGDEDDEAPAPAPPRSPSGKFSLVKPAAADLESGPGLL